jgi:hypothetical protein
MERQWERRTEMFAVKVTQLEKDTALDQASKKGFRSLSGYVRHLIREDKEDKQ